MMKLSEGIEFANRYRLLKQLGQGGFSEVWLAEDVNTGIQIALKIYAPGTGVDDDGIEIFRKEFSLVFDMNHTNLLRPTFFDMWERMPYLILPYCANGSAFKFLKGDNHITEDQCWNLLHDVAAGLAYLHAKKPPVIHQDIKPDNILINDEGHYMITDFGISSRARNTIRKGGAQEQSVGTLAYMAPERFSTKPKPIMASDIWSLGAMMYELITGETPFGNYGGAMQKNGAEIPIIEESVSMELKDIIYRCLALNTWDRPTGTEIEEITYGHLHGFGSISWGHTIQPTPGPAPVPEPVPQPVPVPEPTPQPVPKPNPNKGFNWHKKGPIIAGSIIVVAILFSLLFCTGHHDDNQQTSEETSDVNYGSIFEEKFEKGKELEKIGEALIKRTEPWNMENPDSITETYFIQAVQIYHEILSDSLVIHVTSGLKENIDGHYKNTQKQLQECQSALNNLVNQFSNDEYFTELVNRYKERVNDVKQALKDYGNVP